MVVALVTTPVFLAIAALEDAHTAAVTHQATRQDAYDAALSGSNAAALALSRIRLDQSSALIRGIVRAQDAAALLT